MSRYRLTIAVMLTLTASYQLYAQWTKSLTTIETEAKSQVQQQEQQHVPPPPEAFVEVAQRALPGVEWLRDPRFTFQRGNQFYFYCGSFELMKDAASETDDPKASERVKLAPFVMIWIDPDHPDATPYVIQCEAVRVQFENPVVFGFNAPNPGRVTAAAFDGPVEITGPDGLHLVGENFDFSEESRSLYSARELTFAFGPTADGPSQVRGSAIGVHVNFSTSLDPDLGRDMPRIGGVERVRLLEKVVLDCVYEEGAGNDKEPELAAAHVSCDDTLDFHAVKKEAILLSNVLVRRPTGGERRPDEDDTLRCHQLSLRFVERETPPKSVPSPESSTVELVDGESESQLAASPFGNLRVQEVEALGNLNGIRAMLQSDEHHLTAQFHLMNFDVDTGTAVLSDDPVVDVQRDGTLLRCKTIRVARVPGSRQPVLTCLGNGLLQHHDQTTGDLLLEATWVRQLHAAPDPATGLMVVNFDENARLIVQERAGLRADHLTLWIDDQSMLDQPGDIAPAAPEPAAVSGNAPEGMPLRFFEARGSVVIAKSGKRGETEMRAETELLRAVIEPGKLPYPDIENTRQVADEGQSQPGQNDPWQVASKEVYLWLLNEAGTQNVQVSEIIAKGDVLIGQTPAAPQDDSEAAEVSLAGAHLHLINEGGVHQRVQMTGSPALMRQGDLRLEGRDLRLDRRENRATIVGEGLLQAPVDHDLNGVELEEPMLLDVKWQEGMTFDGGTAAFRKRVLLQLHDSVLQCDEMDVRLKEPISFTEERPDAEQIELRDVSCRNGVHVEIYDWEENKIVGIRKGDLTQFLLDYQSGDFQGDGPGQIHHWSRSAGRRVAIAPPKPAQANVPVASDGLDWEHISVNFDDLLQGNFKDRTAQLHGRVQMIYAPVRRVSESFTRDDLSGKSPSVEHAVWLGCNTLNIEMHSPPKAAGTAEQADDYMVITANGLCELEGHLFNAKADSLSYDESKVQFTLRGKGRHKASIYYRQDPDAEASNIVAQAVHFFPSLRRYSLENSSGFQGSQ